MSKPDRLDFHAAVKVAVDNAALKFDRLYSYLLPAKMGFEAAVGARVVVPFGNGDKLRVGVILGYDDKCNDGCKTVVCCEESPILSDEQVKIIFWLKENTFCSYFDAVRVLLPKLSRAVIKNESDGCILFEQTKGYTETVYIPTGTGTPTKRMSEVINGISAGGDSFSVLAKKTGVSRDTVKRMLERGILRSELRCVDKPIYSNYSRKQTGYTLFDEQQQAYDSIIARIEAGKRETLLHGITSSGKTIIYISLIEFMLKAGKSTLLLVPEIALATQTIYRLRELFGEEVAVIHSGLSDTERQLEWLKIKNGFCRVVVGTRSAVFAPAVDMGLIIVDEEQESAYTSEQSPRYNAISVARYRTGVTDCHLLLSSATPSVCSYYRAEINDAIVRLDKRYLSMPLPHVAMVDMRTELLKGNTGIISGMLSELIKDRLSKKEQVMLLLNRRGFYPLSICTECHEIQKCPRCDVPLVYHKPTGSLVCHYCLHQQPAEGVCAKCGGLVSYKGIGTQRAEEQLAKLFPDARILRLDTDAAGKKGEYEAKIADFKQGRFDIIVGTQMIAKGLDFANVTLAAALSVDQQLLMQDYRVYERCFSMLTQLVGRSGRGEAGGMALIQTVDPDNSIIGYAKNQDYRSFYDAELALRRACLYPPFCALYTLGFISQNEKMAYDAAVKMAELIKSHISINAEIPVRILGPVPFRVCKTLGNYRFKLTVKCRGDRAWNQLLSEALEQYFEIKEFYSVRAFVDVNSDGDY